MDTAKQRIEKILLCKSVNAKQLSELCGYERPQVLYDILNEKTKSISNSISIKITSVFPEINRTWLLTGEGEISEANEQVADTNQEKLIESLNKRIEELQYTIELQKGIINSQRNFMKLNDGSDARPTIQERVEKLSALIVATEEMIMLNQRMVGKQEQIVEELSDDEK